MNAAKTTLVSTVVAAAFGLALGLAAAPAMADKPNPEHNHDNTDSEGGTSFEVTLVGLAGPDGVDTEPDCVGMTPPNKLNAEFSLGCSVIIGDLELNLFSITVRVRGNGMTDVTLFLTEGEEFVPPLSEFVYATDRLGATVVLLEPTPSFELRLNAEDEDLTKLHQPGKGGVVGPIEVGSFFYEPID